MMVLAQCPLDVTVLVDTSLAGVYIQGARTIPGAFFWSFAMDRFPVSKYASARSFERSAGRTRVINVITPMRGGWRL